MSGLRDEFASNMASAMATKVDAEIKVALAKIGVDPMSAALAGRLAMFAYEDGSETLCLDGAAVLKFHPVEVITNTGPSGEAIIRVARKVEALKAIARNPERVREGA